MPLGEQFFLYDYPEPTTQSTKLATKKLTAKGTKF